MAKKKSLLIIIFGFVFLIIGVLWAGVIVHRARPYLVDGQMGFFQDSTAGHPMSAWTPDKRQIANARSAFDKTLIIFFWSIVGLEIACSLFYMIAGLSVVRGYGLSRGWAILAAFCDLLFKVLAVAYHQKIIRPFQYSFAENDIMMNYFRTSHPTLGLISDFLTGLPLTQPYFFSYAIVYICFIGAVFYFFTKPDVIESFS
jgi:hypothetical protein